MGTLNEVLSKNANLHQEIRDLRNELGKYKMVENLDYGDSYEKYKEEFDKGTLKPKEMFIFQMTMHTLAQQALKHEKVKEDCREAINTTWRFIDAYEKNNQVPVGLALGSAKYHLKQADYIFED